MLRTTNGLFPCGFNTVMDATVDCLVNVGVEKPNAIMHHGMEGSIRSGSQRRTLFWLSEVVKEVLTCLAES